ncbi:hypothetical protein SLS62_008316 [Diatrype stigma]|uniref:Inosine/uridine-preferring nucleoside hydrolase domain-containing protein n=1 Tax=Diatrype stigma TaxID=117547 RepID=A0AAN9YNT2_9PEZI
MAPTRIILDTDLSTGAGADVDDGFALALAHADPDIQLDLVTTVNGNTDVESATILTGVLLNRLGIRASDTPLVRGSATPIIHTDEERAPAPHVLALRDDARPPTPGRYAPVAIAEHILAHPGAITVVAVGPLTNVAIALLLEPRIRTAIKELVVVGGVFFGTMCSRARPGSTARCGLVQYHQQWCQSPDSFTFFAGEATKEYIEHQAVRFPGRPRTDSIPMHGPLAVAVVSRPDLCEYREMSVSVITGDGEARGVIIADRLETPDPPAPNCRVAVDVNAEAFRKHFLTWIQEL